jgi:zinc transporter ZupT
MGGNNRLIGQVVILGAVLIAVAGGLLWMAVNGMLPAAAGIGADLDPNVRTVGTIVILSVIVAVFWFILPKGGGSKS